MGKSTALIAAARRRAWGMGLAIGLAVAMLGLRRAKADALRLSLGADFGPTLWRAETTRDDFVDPNARPTTYDATRASVGGAVRFFIGGAIRSRVALGGIVRFGYLGGTTDPFQRSDVPVGSWMLGPAVRILVPFDGRGLYGTVFGSAAFAWANGPGDEDLHHRGGAFGGDIGYALPFGTHGSIGFGVGLVGSLTHADEEGDAIRIDASSRYVMPVAIIELIRR